jgi:hypothetical protein
MKKIDSLLDEPANPARRQLLLGGSGALAAGITALVAGCGESEPASNADPDGSSATAVKLVATFHKRTDLTREEFYDYWLNQYAPYAVQQLTTLGASRYVQSQTDYSALTTALRASRGQVTDAEEGLNSVWFPSADALAANLATAEGAAAFQNLAVAEANFLDLPACSHFFSIEFVFIDG